MGLVSFEMEVSSTIPPAKMFKAFVLDSDNLIPKIMPQAFKSIETLEGNGGPGTIKKINIGDGSQFNYVKHRIEELDKENFIYAYTIIEGDVLMNKLEKVWNEVKFEASPDGGTICKSSSKYHTIGDAEVKEEDIKAGKEKALVMFKAIEAYLQANPDA